MAFPEGGGAALLHMVLRERGSGQAAPEVPAASRMLLDVWVESDDLQHVPRAPNQCRFAGCGPSIQRAVSWLTRSSRCIPASPYDKAFHCCL